MDETINAANSHPPLNFGAGRLSHAYIVGGGLADTLAMAAVCSAEGSARPCLACAHCRKASRHIHPDITIVDILPDKREIVVDQIRELKKDVIVVPNEAEKKAYVINNASLMNLNAQNAFLQILEEPPKHAVFILNTESPAALLPTVRSRCIELSSRLEAQSDDSAAGEMAAGFFSALEQGGAQFARFAFRLEKLEREMFAKFLGSAQEQAAARLRDARADGFGIPCETIARSERLFVRANDMLDMNVSVGHIAGMIFAALISAV